MKKVFPLFSILAMLIITSCKEDEGLSQSSFSESPRFYVNATVNGLPLNLTAGELGYQMYTNFDIIDSVLVMHGTLAADTPQVKNALRLSIRGAELVHTASQAQAGNVFNTGPLPWQDPTGLTVLPGHYDYVFTADTVNGHIPLVWNSPASNSYYGDSCRVMGINSKMHNTFTVEMQSAGPLSCTPSVKHTIRTGQQSKAQIHVHNNSNSGIRAEAQTRIGRIQNVSWEVDGQAAGQGLILNYSTVGFTVSYTVKATINFENGDQEIIEKVILPGGPACDLNIDYSFQGHKIENPHNLKTIELQYFDENGKLYSSSYPNAIGNFVIESISDYNDEASEHKHQRFSFSGHAILKNADGSTLEVSNIFGSFAVAHP